SLLFLEPRKVGFLTLVRPLHGGRIFRLIIHTFHYSAIARRQDIAAIRVVVLKARAIAFMRKPIAAKLCDIERELFGNRPTMAGMERYSPPHIRNAAKRKDISVLRKFGFYRQLPAHFRRLTAAVAVNLHSQRIARAGKGEHL